jgi:hypothetical protein
LEIGQLRIPKCFPDFDIKACRGVAEDELGVTFRMREYMQVG